MPRAGYDDVVLLTGFPSFYARRMCEELVRSGRTLVHAVVRAKLAEEAAQALDELPLEQRSRVNLIDGDAASMDLGLSGAEWKSLAGEIDRIHHCAQVTYLGVDRKTAEQVNVAGARGDPRARPGVHRAQGAGLPLDGARVGRSLRSRPGG